MCAHINLTSRSNWWQKYYTILFEEINALSQVFPLQWLILNPRNFEDLQVEVEAADRAAKGRLIWAGGRSAHPAACLPVACLSVDLPLFLAWDRLCIVPTIIPSWMHLTRAKALCHLLA